MFDFSINITVDNVDEIEELLRTQGYAALEECGIVAEGYAKAKCPVDTGLLRNSITHALNGRKAATETYSQNDTHASTPTTVKNKTAGKPTPGKTGKYEGTAPDEGMAMYLGTNVEYAFYVEEGAGSIGPRRFLRPALENHKKQYKGILEKHLQN